MVAQANPQDTRRYRGVSTVRPIDYAKEKVSILELAERESGSGIRRGQEVYFRCPLHDDHHPSLRVNPAKGVWWCAPCLQGGDVVELARLVWGYSQREAAMAAANLLQEFGHEIPSRPPAWHRRQSRQESARRAMEQAAIRRTQRRLYRWIFAPILATFEDEDERLEEAAYAWADAETVARNIVNYARGEGGVV